LRWRFVVVGKPRLAYARDGAAEYLGRLKGFAPVEIGHVKASDPAREGERLLALSEGCFRLVLDERGKTFSSRAFAAEVEKISLQPRKTCAVIIGGSDGLPPSVREKADLLWSLSPLTLQHELALVVALEQLYRAHTLLAGLPYHRD
jgi:23S rRNA (pseudouridine1915-N3)-methyltransferase